MPKKTSVQGHAAGFRDKTEVLLQFCGEADKLPCKAHGSLAYEAAIIKLYAAFEQMIAGALKGAINNDTDMLSGRTGTRFPKHLTDAVCEYIITGGQYFDFRGAMG